MRGGMQRQEGEYTRSGDRLALGSLHLWVGAGGGFGPKDPDLTLTPLHPLQSTSPGA